MDNKPADYAIGRHLVDSTHPNSKSREAKAWIIYCNNTYKCNRDD